VAFHVTDMERSIAFYCGVLGLTQGVRLHNDAGGPGCLLKLRQAFIELFYNGTGRLIKDPPGGTTI
jgi:catechol 2,3-dioxygenase-like lactoylglutathione lyase family enzyme